MINQSAVLEEEIKARAVSLGFSLAAITDASPLENHSRFVNWLEMDRHAQMAYLASPRHIEARKDPHHIWPEVKSILVLALSYPLHDDHLLNEHNIGLISGYAWGEDYHIRIPRMLAPLISWLKSLYGNGCEARIFTDSAPILERELAVRAGLGWIGRNSCLISPTFGSTLILGEVFLNVPLKPDSPFTADRCGSCSRCVEACPTQCIQSDRTVDSNGCLSYHTIENRGEIPASVKKAMGNWIFGCDVCQQVCPWNNRPNSPKFDQLENTYSEEEMAALLHMDAQGFKQKYSSSSISRAKWSGFLRNIGIVLQNIETNR